MYRFKSVSAASAESGVREVAIPGESSGYSSYQKWIQALGLRLPGWRIRTVSVRKDNLIPLFKYGVDLDGLEGPTITLIREN